MKGTNLDCEQFKCCKLPHIKVWSQTKYARSHVSPTLISVRDLLQLAVCNFRRIWDAYLNGRERPNDLKVQKCNLEMEMVMMQQVEWGMCRGFQLQVYSVDEEEDIVDRMEHMDGICLAICGI